ncbi:unnamed protein product [Blepharisma stoltei]|uniref:Uncharacterized protein n=1 Tax=Blepharisma stoltei TaxID=1481888 RepID=A0AAU9IP03_9CILI|nr:unnamed protein product [Blepharisma stoltei]
MFSGRCFKDGCTSKLHGICKCEGLILFCKEHGLEHVESPTPKGHQIVRCYFKPAEEIKKPIIDKLIEFKRDIKNLGLKRLLRPMKL